MPRGKAPAELWMKDLYQLFLETPWWVSPLVAAFTYLIFILIPHLIPADPGNRNIGFIVARSVFQGLALLAPWIAATILLIGIAAQVGKWKRGSLLNRQTGRASLRDLSWHEFELLVGEAYRRRGYEVQETGRAGADGGVDLALRKDGKRVLVQCKQWKSWKVGVSQVRELYGVMASERADHGILVTCGDFTSDAIAFAQGKNLELVDGKGLHKLVQAAQPVIGSDENKPAVEVQQSPRCPKCGGLMIIKTARRGTNAGQEFWSCAAFPKCRGARDT